MVCKVTSISRGSRAESLTSTVIGMGLATILFAAVASCYLYTTRSFLCLGNYMDMDSNVRLALDTISSDVRGATSLSTYSSNAVMFLVGTNQLAYNLAVDRRTLNRRFNSTTRTLLTDCDDVRFDVFARNLTNSNYDYFPTSGSPTNCKLVEVTVLCSRSILGRKANSTTVQSAKIVMRNEK